jgi:hypothetical protein
METVELAAAVALCVAILLAGLAMCSSALAAARGVYKGHDSAQPTQYSLALHVSAENKITEVGFREVLTDPQCAGPYVDTAYLTLPIRITKRGTFDARQAPLQIFGPHDVVHIQGRFSGRTVTGSVVETWVGRISGGTVHCSTGRITFGGTLQ